MKTEIQKEAAEFEAKLRKLPKPEQRQIEAMIDERLKKGQREKGKPITVWCHSRDTGMGSFIFDD